MKKITTLIKSLSKGEKILAAIIVTLLVVGLATTNVTCLGWAGIIAACWWLDVTSKRVRRQERDIERDIEEAVKTYRRKRAEDELRKQELEKKITECEGVIRRAAAEILNTKASDDISLHFCQLSEEEESEIERSHPRLLHTTLKRIRCNGDKKWREGLKDMGGAFINKVGHATTRLRIEGKREIEVHTSAAIRCITEVVDREKEWRGEIHFIRLGGIVQANESELIRDIEQDTAEVWAAERGRGNYRWPVIETIPTPICIINDLEKVASRLNKAHASIKEKKIEKVEEKKAALRRSFIATPVADRVIKDYVDELDEYDKQLDRLKTYQPIKVSKTQISVERTNCSSLCEFDLYGGMLMQGQRDMARWRTERRTAFQAKKEQEIARRVIVLAALQKSLQELGENN